MPYTTRFVIDTLRNFVTGLGQPGVDPTKSVEYYYEQLDRNTLENMYRGDWLARKICDAPAEDMTREWRAWKATQEQIEAIELVEKTLDVQRKVKQWITRARLYGGAALVIGVDDGNDPSQPLDLEKCGKGCLKYVVVLSNYDLAPGPLIYNVLDPYYMRPEYYTVSTPMYGFSSSTLPAAVEGQASTSPAKNFFSNVMPFTYTAPNKRPANEITRPGTSVGMTQIHPSRVLPFAGNELPDLRLAPLGGGWGDSVLQTVIEAISGYNTTVQAVSALVNDAKMDVVKIPEMAINLTSPGYKQKLLDRFTLSAQTKSVISALLIDKEEEWERISTNFGGLPMIIHEFLTLTAGAAGIAVSRLFGSAPGQGLEGGATGGDGDSDLRNYYDGCADKQKNEVGPRIGMLDQVMIRSATGTLDPSIHYEWNPLWQKSDTEKAAIAYQKAQTTSLYVTAGLINADALREGVVNQLIEDGTYPGLEDAIEEFGSEPEATMEEIMAFGGFGGPTGGGGGEEEEEGGSPDAEEYGATG